MAEDEKAKEKYHEELAEQFQYCLRSNAGPTEERCWELAKMAIEERYAIRSARAKAVAEGKEPFRAQLEDALRRYDEKDALKIN